MRKSRLEKMRRKPVDSSSLVSVGYDPKRRILEIEFEGGGVYDYLGVPPEVFAALMEAPSKGAYVNDVVKEGFRFVRR